MVDFSKVEKVLRQLEREFDGRVKVDIVERVLYEKDATAIPIETKTPQAVIFPTSKEEVRRIVEVLYNEGIPMIPRGAGSCLTGGAVGYRGDEVVISFEKMNKFRIDLDNATVVAQPGVITYELQRAVEKHGLFYPPDPSSYKFSTIGGNIAENAGGPRCVKYGVTRDYVLGLEGVIKYGETFKFGAPVMKDVAGYDFTKFLVGSEGTLGIITEAILRLIPLPKERRVLLAFFDRLEDVGRAVTKIMTSGVFPSALEFMDRACIKAVNDYKGLGLPEDKVGLLLIEIDGHPIAVQEELVEVENLLKEMGVDVRVARTKEEEENLWAARRALGPAISKLGSGKVNEDIVVPRSRLAEYIPAVNRLAEKYGLICAIFGHIGDGNLHVNFMFDKTNPEEVQRVERAVEELFKLTVDFGGSITGEHGVGITKKPFLKLQLGDVGIELVRGVKKLFDPLNLFNPGKLVDL
ncbi:MAG TPA: FAD-binding protein [Aquifex sp.]|nr:FAD-binding protein [Aquifex sp.]